MKKALLIVATLVVGMLLGAVAMGTAFAAGPTLRDTLTTIVPGFGHGGMMGQGQGRGAMMGDYGFEDEVLALLGMTREQLITERQAGKSLVQIAQAKGKTEQQLVSTILAAKRADLDKAVADKSITQAQADLMYQNMQAQVPQMVNRTTTGPASGQGMRTGTGNQSGARMGGRGMGR